MTADEHVDGDQSALVLLADHLDRAEEAAVDDDARYHIRQARMHLQAATAPDST